jgi:hypothetical protein
MNFLLLFDSFLKMYLIIILIINMRKAFIYNYIIFYFLFKFITISYIRKERMEEYLFI